RRSYVLVRQPGQRSLGHVPLAAIGEEPRRLGERQPPRLGDLVTMRRRDVAEAARGIADEEERDDLEHPFALPLEPVADVAELAERPAADAGLLLRLPERRPLARLARVDLALRERPDARRLAAGPDRRDHELAAQPADDDSPCREFTPHGPRS